MQWRRSFGNNSDIVGVCLCRLNLALGTMPVDRLGGFVQLGSWQFCQQMRRWGSCWLTNKKDSISCCKVDCCNYCWKSGGWSHLKFQGRGNSAHQWDLPSLPISFFPTLLNQTIIPKPKPTPTPVPESIENWSCIWCVACKSEQQIQFLPQEFILLLWICIQPVMIGRRNFEIMAHRRPPFRNAGESLPWIIWLPWLREDFRFLPLKWLRRSDKWSLAQLVLIVRFSPVDFFTVNYWII